MACHGKVEHPFERADHIIDACPDIDNFPHNSGNPCSLIVHT